VVHNTDVAGYIPPPEPTKDLVWPGLGMPLPAPLPAPPGIAAGSR